MTEKMKELLYQDLSTLPFQRRCEMLLWYSRTAQKKKSQDVWVVKVKFRRHCKQKCSGGTLRELHTLQTEMKCFKLTELGL